ncbi:MAG: hypothetical protein H6685_00360 [Deltaproteobacteria bacterium]|nr:hypothetical protein [Deltaproteobacteria bacterium]
MTIIALTAVIVVAVVLFRLPHQVPAANADVWKIFSGIVREVPRYARAFEGAGEVRRVLVNDNQLFYRNTMTTDSPQDVIDHYEQLYRRKEIKLFPESVRKSPEIAKRPDVIKFTEVLDDYINARISRVVRKDVDGISVLAYLDMGEGDFFDNYMSRGPEFVETGQVESLGVGKAVVAMEAAPGKTTVLNFWTGTNFNVKNMIPLKGKDTPGTDPADFQRMPNDRRLLSTAEIDSLARVKTYVYRGELAPRECIFHFLRALPEDGWEKSALHEKLDVSKGNNDTLLFFKKNRELTVSCQPSGHGASVAFVVERQLRG